ncbi:MAG: glycosyltransferase family 9 protein, partial [Bacteroidota bacterium]
MGLKGPRKESPGPDDRSARRQWDVPDCRHFTGYKPCFPATRCYDECVNNDPIGKRILIINLDAMGNVLVTTTILPSLKRTYPQSHISWITLGNAYPLLQNNPFLDRLYRWEPESWLILQQLTFDLVLNVDKSRRAGAFLSTLHARERLGFGINENGVIVPLNPEAEENYILGLDDDLKFRVNAKTVPQILSEQFRLEYRRDNYTLRLTEAEQAFCEEFKREHELTPDRHGRAPFIVGFNTGCSELYPNKKMTIDQHVRLIMRLSEEEGIRLLLVGGPEDTIRNAEIARRVGDRVVNTPSTEGLRRGLCYINICDLVVSGDSFGMHAAIALKKHVVVWFGVSCSTEIDLFERGTKLIPPGLECSPCWKQECP